MDSEQLNDIHKDSEREIRLDQNTSTKSLNLPALIVSYISLRASRRIAWLRHLWNEMHQNQEEHLHHLIDHILSHKDSLEAELSWRNSQESLAQINKDIDAIEEILQKDQRSFLFILKTQLGLNADELQLLYTSLAFSWEPDLARVFAYLQNKSGLGYVTEHLVNRLFDCIETQSVSNNSPLFIWDIIYKHVTREGDPNYFTCDRYVLERLEGKKTIDHDLLGKASIKPAYQALKNWPVEEVVNLVKNRIQSNVQQPIRIIVSGLEGSGRTTFAAVVCQQLSLPLIELSMNKFEEQNWQKIYIHTQRHAVLELNAIAWKYGNWEKINWPNLVLPFQLQFIICLPDESVPHAEGLIDFRFEIPSLSIEERKNLWETYLPESNQWKEEEKEHLIKRYQLTIGQIISLSRQGIEKPADAIDYLRNSYGNQIGKLAQKLECPFRWDDLILNPWLETYLQDLMYEAKEREEIWEEESLNRLFPQGKGLVALFSGPPGTGKTMASQVIAAELGLDLYRIDLSRVVSKYVGETSKNLDQILSKASHLNAVLLFDEADALFGKRTDIKDAHDRYANTDTNYLLQAIENYQGIAILATNKKSNIDHGFIRRLRYVLEFPKPDKEQRLRLWQHLLVELAGDEIVQKMHPFIIEMAHQVELNGAQIKFAILTAIFLGKKTDDHLQEKYLIKGLERELVKEGRSIRQEFKSLWTQNIDARN